MYPVHLLRVLSAEKMEVQLIENTLVANTQANLFDMRWAGCSLSDQTEDVVMGEKFGQDQNKSDNSEGDLHSFSPEAAAGDRLLPPLRRRPFTE